MGGHDDEPSLLEEPKPFSRSKETHACDRPRSPYKPETIQIYAETKRSDEKHFT